MNNFFEKNKIVLVVVIGALVVGAAIYFSSRKSNEAYRGQTPVKTPSGTECQNIPELKDGERKLATKIIDGDTFLIEGGSSVRILGIDADEKGYPCYEAAKNELEKLILNKEVRLEKGVEDKDQWCRYLRYVFLDDKNISLELVEEGLAVARFSPEDVKYREEITKDEKTAKENKIGCKWSSPAPQSGATEDKSERIQFEWEKLTLEITGLNVIGVCQAGNYYGKEALVEGKIADTYRSKTNTVFLNFEKPYPNQCFTSVIFSSDQYKFVESPEKYYSNKTVRVKGVIKEYQGKPEIILRDPSQIEVGK